MIDESVRSLAQGGNFAALTTVLPSGHLQTSVMWVDADDEHLIINTEVHRTKYKNVQRDPRVTVAVIDRENPYHYAEVRGRVVGERHGAEARQHIDQLSERYTGHPYDPSAIQTERVMLLIEPERQRVN